jgi:pimeloyl-ACP methyl ester carboxylesterase
MGRRVKIGIGLLAALLALLALNAVWVDGKTEEAEVTVPVGRILDLPDGDLQVAEHGSRDGSPIVLIHCYTCAMDWWDRMVPLLEPGHRVVLVDLLGHGGSEKPSDGYDPPNQAKVVAEALERLGVKNATVVGHSLGGSVTVALSEQSPALVKRAVIVDMPPDNTYDDGHGLIAQLGYTPLIGEALWQVKPDASVRDGLGVAFAPGYDVPDAFVEDLKRITYTVYDDSPSAIDHYIHEESLDQRMKATGKPLMVLAGAEEQLIDDPQRALDQYADGAGAETHLIAGAGHSPNVERPALTAKLVLRFAEEPRVGIPSPQHRASGVRSATGRQ